jgi:hypothetical protein
MFRWIILLIGLGLPASSMPDSELTDAAQRAREPTVVYQGRDGGGPLMHIIAEKY